MGNGKTCARNAYHSKVIAYPENQAPIAREVYANNGLAAQSDRRILFGLGSLKDKKIRIQIQWCGHGKAQEMELETGRYHRVEQP